MPQAASCCRPSTRTAPLRAQQFSPAEFGLIRSAADLQSVPGHRECLLHARCFRRPAAADRGECGACRISALRARSDLSDADRERRDRGDPGSLAARPDRGDAARSSRRKRDQLVVVRNQFEAGAATRADVLQQESEVATTEATLPPLQKQLEQQHHVLLALIGHFPNEARARASDAGVVPSADHICR